MGGRNWLDFSAGDGAWHYLCIGMKQFLLCGRSGLIWVRCKDRKWLDFCVVVDKDFFSRVWIEINSFDIRAGIEIDLILVIGNQLSWFLCAGRKWLVCRVVIDWLGFCVGGRNCLGFCLRDGNHLALVWGSKLTCFWYGWSKLTCFALFVYFYPSLFFLVFLHFLRVSLSIFFSLWEYRCSWRMYVVPVVAKHNGMILYYCCQPGTT